MLHFGLIICCTFAAAPPINCCTSAAAPHSAAVFTHPWLYLNHCAFAAVGFNFGLIAASSPLLCLLLHFEWIIYCSFAAAPPAAVLIILLHHCSAVCCSFDKSIIVYSLLLRLLL
jgi:hypothetical protein